MWIDICTLLGQIKAAPVQVPQITAGAGTDNSTRAMKTAGPPNHMGALAGLGMSRYCIASG
jgi:hypothetical protein